MQAEVMIPATDRANSLPAASVFSVFWDKRLSNYPKMSSLFFSTKIDLYAARQ